MGGKSDYLEKKLLDHVLGNTAYSAPGTVYAALFTATPDDTGCGTEVSGGSYARVSVTNNTTNFPNASGSGLTPSSKATGAAITFPTASATWGVCVAFGLFDASSAGNLLYWGLLSTNVTVNSGDTASFASGALVVTED